MKARQLIQRQIDYLSEPSELDEISVNSQQVNIDSIVVSYRSIYHPLAVVVLEESIDFSQLRGRQTDRLSRREQKEGKIACKIVSRIGKKRLCDANVGHQSAPVMQQQ